MIYKTFEDLIKDLKQYKNIHPDCHFYVYEHPKKIQYICYKDKYNLKRIWMIKNDRPASNITFEEMKEELKKLFLKE